MGEPREPDALRLPLVAPTHPSTADDVGVALDLRGRTIDLGQRFLVMGIVNATPDSFYDRGATFGVERSVDHAEGLIADGADIIDIGGVKGGPGTDVTVEDEIGRVLPVIRSVRERSDVLISVDTFRAAVADAALEAGADIINDVTGAWDPGILDVVARHDAGYVAMHHGGEPRTRPFRRSYQPDVTGAVVSHCRELTDRAVAAGVHRRRLIVDPGHDFQKTTSHSLQLSRRLPELAELGYPVLVALSNKDFIGETLNAPLGERVDGSLAAAVFCLLRGANIVRVHEVARTVEAVHMVESLLGWRRPAVAIRGLE